MDLNKSNLLKKEKTVSNLLKKEGLKILQSWRLAKTIQWKKHHEPVTKMDIEIENSLRQALKKILPEAGFFVEEGASFKKHRYNWVIDPIDQTKNLIGQLPLFFIQVALLDKGRPILGVIYNPVSQQLFSATKGNGARLNNQIIEKPKSKKLSQSIIDLDFGGNDDEINWKITILKKMIKKAFLVRMTGGAFSPYLLTTGISAQIIINKRNKMVDVAPQIILTRELGLSFKLFEKQNHKILLAGEQRMVQEIQNLLSLSSKQQKNNLLTFFGEN